jgi:hypothetical protein
MFARFVERNYSRSSLPWWRFATAFGAHRDGTREAVPCYCSHRHLHPAKKSPVARDEKAPTNRRNCSPDAERAVGHLLGDLLVAAEGLLGDSLVGVADLRGGILAAAAGLLGGLLAEAAGWTFFAFDVQEF